MIKRLSYQQPDFDSALAALLEVPEADTGNVKDIVSGIINDVRTRGDQAVLELTNRFDRVNHQELSELVVSDEEMQAGLARVDPLVVEALKTSIERVRLYHEAQFKSLGAAEDWSYEDQDGNLLGQRVRAMTRAGVYVPGGKATYPSSVIMTVIPAKVAGVKEVILTVPAPDGEVSDVLLAAAALCGIDKMIKVGGAQAVAALAYGTETIPRVDKIVGPGNIFVATAKELVFGDVGIDMIAGPSEVVIVADDTANPEWLVMDMFAQAEHDELAQAILISTSEALLDSVAALIDETQPTMQRADIIGKSIADRGCLIHADSIATAAEVVNQIAPEHLELVVDDADGLMDLIVHAGAIFVGSHSAEVVGDYSAGPSHVLPTSGTARFASPLGVYDFLVRSSIIRCNAKGSVVLSRAAQILATEEGLEAHARSAGFRVQG